MGFSIREAGLADADAIAAVFSPSLRLLHFLPELYTVAEERWFIEHVILKEATVLVAEEEGAGILSFLALQGDEIRLLHSHPDHIGRGAGRALVAHAKTLRQHLELWCFQSNADARRFYERLNFEAVEFTDGRRNEEGLPDMRYVWRGGGEPGVC